MYHIICSEEEVCTNLIVKQQGSRLRRERDRYYATELLANYVAPVGCFYQLGGSSTSTGKVLNTFIQTYTTSGNAQCSIVCNSQNFNFYGTVNVGPTSTTSVDCYCGDTLSFVSTYIPRLEFFAWVSCWIARSF